ncbi:hypothetical protein BU23DRAFT_570946 [Bimuria novae-zelandiae CBS 107.79]|uniref:WW domain-containing protein n=1 Tax=Bimuria novae-zelandiae CBS 107.79 TaxID=1447943 RepID=A0A6A5V1M1_9PLEO|nr:hypothetical protein BU23DRAFT_570946 [Bimuria novae-zelandiae CBS 107.79]
MSAPTPPRQGAASPDSGPTDPALPKLPSGWIAQWDNTVAPPRPTCPAIARGLTEDIRSRKYYYVQISTGVSQWDLPTSEAPIGGGSNHGTPAHDTNPYTRPADGAQGPDVGNGTRGVDGPTGDRAGGLGGFALNALTGGNKHSGGQGGGSNNLVGQLASGLLGGGKQSHGSSGHGGGSSNLVGQLASGLLGGGKQNHGSSQLGQGSSGHSSSSGGGLGGLLGGVLGGGSHSKPSNSDYGYSHTTSQGGTYTGSAPPTSYQPGGSHASTPSHNPYSSPPPGQYGSHDQQQGGGYGQHQHQQAGYGGQNQGYPPAAQGYGSPAPPAQHQQSQHGGHNQQYSAPPNQHQGSYGGASGYGQQAGYGGPVYPQQHQPPQGQFGHAPYGGPQNFDQHQHNQYGGAPPYSAPPQQQHSYGNQGGPPQPGWWVSYTGP